MGPESRSKESLASYRKFRRAIPCINDKLNHYFDYRRLVMTTGYILPDVATKVVYFSLTAVAVIFVSMLLLTSLHP